MKNILRLRVLAILLLALGLVGSAVPNASAQEGTPPAGTVGTLSVTLDTGGVDIPTLSQGGGTASAAEGEWASFELYLNSDMSSGPFWAFTVDAGETATHDAVPVGTHLLVLTGSSSNLGAYSWTVYVGPNTSAPPTVITISIPQAPNTPPTAPGGPGSLSVSSFESDQVSYPYFSGGINATANEDGGVDFIEADFALYLNTDHPGAGAANPWREFSTKDGAAYVRDDVPVGHHSLVYYPADGSNAYSYGIDIYNGQLTAVTLLIPSGTFSGNTNTGSLVLSSYAFQSSTTLATRWWEEIVDTPAQGEGDAVQIASELVGPPDDAKYSGAYVVDRQFTININGGGTGLNLQTDGGVALFDNLPPGTHRITDAQTGSSADFTIVAGRVTALTVIFPEGFGNSGSTDCDKDTQSPRSCGETDGGDKVDTGSDSSSDGGNNNGGNGGGGKVSSLPSTGQGSNSTDSSTIVLILGAMSLVALAGGFAWRQRRTA